MASKNQAAKKTAARPATRAQLTPQASGDPVALASEAAKLGPMTAEQAADAAEQAGEELVMATVVKPFRLTLDNYREVVYEPGVQEMPRSHADHWYAKANGVKLPRGA